MLTSIQVSQQEFSARADALLDHIQAHSLSGVVLFDDIYVMYYGGFAFIPTERPIAFCMNAKGEKALFVPRLELEHAQANVMFDRVEHYLEYPDDPHPMEFFKNLLNDMGVAGAVGADHDGYPWILGYRGPKLSHLTGANVVDVKAFVEDQMAIKSAAEILLIKESVKWSNLAHKLMQRYTKVGKTETDVCGRASHEATLAMLDAIGPIYRAQSKFFSGPITMYRGQIGRTSAIPHAMANNIVFQPGDVLVTGATTPVWGYLSELERTMFMGPPSDEQRRLFDHMVNLQDIAFATMEPGKPGAEVDKALRAYYEKHDLMPLWRHHTGHTLGLRYHEGPYLDSGDTTEMKPGMVFSVEPGLYSPELGGFRHSDTVVIIEDGIERLTYYPRDIDSLTLPI